MKTVDAPKEYKFYTCIITHMPTLVCWSVPAYAKSPDEALANKRLTWRDSKLWDIAVELDKD
jgi:hypothetical protein